MDFETFSKLIDEGDIESIANVLADLSEQDQNDLVDMLSPEQAIKLIAMVNTPNTAVEEETQLSDNSDIVNEPEDTEDVDLEEERAKVKAAMYADIDSVINEPDTEDVNGDGDTDVATADTNGNGEKDTAVVTADSEPEKKEAVKAAKEGLGLDKEDKTSTGKTKGELEDDKKSAKEIRDERTKSYGPMREYHDMDDKDVVSDEKKKDMTCSDATQKNIMAALIDHRF